MRPHVASLLIAFIVFATVMFFTPGPNNIMLLSSGLTYGFRPTMPHIIGITVGFAFMIGAVGLGLGTIFIAYPVLQTILKYAGVAYLVYLAVRIAMSEPPSAEQDNRRAADDLLGRGHVPMGQRQGLGDGDRHHHGLCGDRRLPLEYRDSGRPEPAPGHPVLHRLGACSAVRCGRC